MAKRLVVLGDAPGPGASELSPGEIVVAYHERTKHRYGRYARALGYMDWDTQPDPFRRYAGAPLVQLPVNEPANLLPDPESTCSPGGSLAHPKGTCSPGGSLAYWQLYVPGAVAAEPLSLESISRFFRHALSLTAWKRLGDTSWPLRVNPSSGNLHPTEGYALLPAVAGIHTGPAVYHYAAKEHGLERRADLEPSWWSAVAAALPAHGFVVGLSSILWREAWKYGERAFRYCQHDVGHAIGTLRFAAAARGWRLALVAGSHAIEPILGLDRDADYAGAEREHPDLLAVVSPGHVGDPVDPRALLAALARPMATARWYGTANQLSRDHVAWPVIDEVAAATLGVPTALDAELGAFPSEAELFEPPIRASRFTADKVILQRRSAVSMDGTTGIPVATFFAMLGRLLPTRDRQAVPWDALPWRPHIHLGLFVHRVHGLPSGLYALVRDPEQLGPLRAAMRCDFMWQRPTACPPGLPLYLLQAGDCQALAAGVSCGQAIAGDGAFSLGMIADYMGSLVRHGAAFYRNLFWEAGLVGQVLYLEAEAAGLRATGIGCYFDDPVHEVFGIDTRDWQSFYHFTVGGPVDDPRLTTLPAYDKETA